ncbi:HD domain-containing protein [Bacillus sp. 31A1R]|uniref:HD domain-containing protein n=1 Tax=Robertmurraya mangrovi TaxID=3098077 RepID=A0ABU5J1B3_9BACI|nr:HD domain-containing protein [Bacillus sp. 31A1R]MDZ5473155.1 HD domain-containing protein [Bacillus sp. 31A1R]
MQKKMIEEAKKFAKETLGEDATGHDWYHIERVHRSALHIWEQEKVGDRFIIEMAALLHDIPDEKLNESKEAGEKKLHSFLDSINLDTQTKKHILDIIFSISFKGGNGSALPSIEAAIVQDADRLDAIGAIGIARAFAFGGKKGQSIYDPELTVREQMTVEEYRKGKSSSVHHFYEKLLKLKNRLNTETAKKMAEKRHAFMEQFLTEFHNDWNGKNEIDFN